MQFDCIAMLIAIWIKIAFSFFDLWCDLIRYKFHIFNFQIWCDTRNGKGNAIWEGWQAFVGVAPFFLGAFRWPSLFLECGVWILWWLTLPLEVVFGPFSYGCGWPFLLRVVTGPSLLWRRFAIPSQSGGLVLLGLGPRSEGWSPPLLGMGWPFLLGVGVCPFFLGVRVGLVFSGCGSWPS